MCSAARTVTVTSTGTIPLTFTGMSISPSGQGFSVTNGCPATLNPGHSCQAQIRFTPPSEGAKSANLVINDNAGVQRIDLRGNGIPDADLAISANADPNPALNFSSLTYYVNVLNHGPKDAVSVRMIAALPSGFRFEDMTAPAGWTCTMPPVGDTGTTICRASTLRSADSAQFVIYVRVVVYGRTTISMTASTDASTDDPEPANNSVTVSSAVEDG